MIKDTPILTIIFLSDAFDTSADNIGPSHGVVNPPGPPLLSDHENIYMGDFFENPDEAKAMEFNEQVPFGFGNFDGGNGQIPTQQEQLNTAGLYNVITPSVHESRPVSASNSYPRLFGSDPNMPFNLSSTPDLENIGDHTLVDDDHLGANMLMTLQANGFSNDNNRFGRSMGSRRHSEYSSIPWSNNLVTNQAPMDMSQTLNSALHPSLGALPHVTHMPNMATFTRSNGLAITNDTATSATPRQPAIPLGLQFDTDITFSRSVNQIYDRRATVGGFVNNELWQGYAPLYTDTSTTPQSMEMPPPAHRTPDTRPVSGVESLVTMARQSAMTSSTSNRKRLRGHDESTSSSPQTSILNQDPRSPDSTVSRSTNSTMPAGQDSPIRPPSKSSNNAGPSSRTPKTGTPSLSTQKASKSATNANGSAAKRQKLSDSQRKENHTNSEKRRRAEMKQAYADIAELVPQIKTSSGVLSKSQILRKVAIAVESTETVNNIMAARIAAIKKEKGLE